MSKAPNRGYPLNHDSDDTRLPVTLVSGLKGVGKTTLLQRIVNNVEGLRIAAIVNRTSAGAEWPWGAGQATAGSADVYELHGGCLCCSARRDLWDLIRTLERSGHYDYLLIEANCVSEPLSVAASLYVEEPETTPLIELIRLDTLVTVVDASTFLTDYGRTDTLLERGLALDDTDDRSISDVLAEQVEFANVVLINKAERVDTGAMRRLEAVLRSLNPNARVIQCTHGVTPLEGVVATGLFDFEAASQASGWQRALGGQEGHAGEEFGLRSYVYRARRPFHPGRLWDALQRDVPGLIRAKGFFWLASRHNHAGVWSQAGHTFRDDLAGRWWASLPKEEWPDEPTALEEIHRLHQGPYGDRRQELAFIGESIDVERIQEQLDQCLLDDIEMGLGQQGWERFADPFSAWWDEDEGEISGRVDIPSA